MSVLLDVSRDGRHFATLTASRRLLLRFRRLSNSGGLIHSFAPIIRYRRTLLQDRKRHEGSRSRREKKNQKKKSSAGEVKNKIKKQIIANKF